MNPQPQLYILIASIIGSVFLLWMLVPKKRLVDAHISFLFMQAQTWLYGILVSEFQLIRYPVRILEKGDLSNFPFEFFFFPAISVIYNLYFPKVKNLLNKLLYVVLFPTTITMVEVWLESKTELIDYIHWSWFWSWVTMLLTLNIAYIYYKWFMKRLIKK